jgi:hypothetical protein
MKKDKNIQDKRREFVMDYLEKNKEKQKKVIVLELSERLFLTERTIHSIINEGRNLKSK